MLSTPMGTLVTKKTDPRSGRMRVGRATGDSMASEITQTAVKIPPDPRSPTLYTEGLSPLQGRGKDVMREGLYPPGLGSGDEHLINGGCCVYVALSLPAGLWGKGRETDWRASLSDTGENFSFILSVLGGSYQKYNH